MELSKETKELLEKDKQRLEREIKSLVGTAKELAEEINAAQRDYNSAIYKIREKMETGIKIDLQLKEGENPNAQVSLGDSYSHKELRKIREHWEKMTEGHK